MSRVTSERCCRLTPDDATNAQSTTWSSPLMSTCRAMERHGDTGKEWGNAKHWINRSKERQIEWPITTARQCWSLMSPSTRSTMKWRCLVLMFYHRSRPPEQTRGSSQTWGWIRLDSNRRWTGIGAVSRCELRGLHNQTIAMTFFFVQFIEVVIKSIYNLNTNISVPGLFCSQYCPLECMQW